MPLMFEQNNGVNCLVFREQLSQGTVETRHISFLSTKSNERAVFRRISKALALLEAFELALLPIPGSE